MGTTHFLAADEKETGFTYLLKHSTWNGLGYSFLPPYYQQSNSYRGEGLSAFLEEMRDQSLFQEKGEN